MTRRRGSLTAIRAFALAAATLFAALPLAGCDQAPAGGTASGAEIYQLCTQCHGPHGLGNPSANTPAIGGLPAWYVEAQLLKFRSGQRGTHPDDLTGMQMRPIARSLMNDVDVKTIAEYVATMPRYRPVARLEGADPARGAALFKPCQACHGMSGEGNEATKAPPLQAQSDWYIARQLMHFRAGIRGTHPEDATGGMMRPQAVMLPDDQATKDIAAFIAQAK
ncbi:MAG: c-type cytochrome [Myxococcales bacterium]|nr:c-type cytochrome [Myxococcales bacterium]